ncbi:outer membrane beta-barrel protein [Hymenobacter defluvii]|nr:outer membrane beta-barrel protein [Hymenobacter defluvii]
MLMLTTALLAAALASEPGDSVQKKPFVFSGSADGYYRYNFSNPQEGPYNNLTSFTNSHNSFELGMISLKAAHTIGKVGLVADVGFGRRAEEFSYNDDRTRFAIKQLYVTYAPTEKIKLTAGSWATHIGYESVDPYLNRNYSMSYMFSYGPFFHTGLKAEVSVGDKTTLMVGIANPTDFKSASSMPKMAIAQLATSSRDDKLKVYLNYQGGRALNSLRLHQEDLVLSYLINSKLSFSYNGTMQQRRIVGEGSDEYHTWWGSALYANLDPQPWLGFTLRAEYTGDKNYLLGLSKNVIETTLSSNIRIDNLTIIPEIRLDRSSADDNLFVNKAGNSKNATVSGLIAAVYAF